MFTAATTAAFSQERSLKDQLVGTWAPVAIENTAPDGKKITPWGEKVLGTLMFDSGGRFSQTLLRSDLPKIATNNRLQATPEENKAVVNGMITFYGTYTVTGADALTYHIDGSSFPNFNGTEQKRVAKISGDDLTVTVAGASSGGTATQVWRRAK
jgi:hypothetical protein